MHRASRPLNRALAHCRWLVSCIGTLWGWPIHLADKHTFFRRDHAMLMDWLGALERLLRVVLAGMALKLNLPALAPRDRRKPQTRRPPPRDYHLWFDTRPDTWPACFRFFARPSRPGRIRKPRRRPWKLRFVAIFTASRRLEAAIRVIRDPAPFAHRLARTFARLKAAARGRNEPHDLDTRLLPRFPKERTRGHRASETGLNPILQPTRDRLGRFLEAT